MSKDDKQYLSPPVTTCTEIGGGKRLCVTISMLDACKNHGKNKEGTLDPANCSPCTNGKPNGSQWGQPQQMQPQMQQQMQPQMQQQMQPQMQQQMQPQMQQQMQQQMQPQMQQQMQQPMQPQMQAPSSHLLCPPPNMQQSPPPQQSPQSPNPYCPPPEQSGPQKDSPLLKCCYFSDSAQSLIEGNKSDVSVKEEPVRPQTPASNAPVERDEHVPECPLYEGKKVV